VLIEESDDAQSHVDFQMVSLLIGIIYYGQVLDQDGVMNMNGALFLFLTNMTFQNVFAVINVSDGSLREKRLECLNVSAGFLSRTANLHP
jgi:ATP-binding cassette, subfamily G (WHITE), eye pigment precursor transporter